MDDLKGLELRSLVGGDGILRVSLETVAVAKPEADEVVVRIEAAPINPSDLALLFGAADPRAVETSGSGDATVLTAPIPASRMAGMAGRVGQSLPVGNEGAGTVVQAGANAQALLGRTVATLGGAMYAQYRVVKAAACLVLPEDVSAAEGAAAFVNPLTALGMTETMRREGHSALVHTAAASNLGQMLVKLCLKDGIALVNIVRSAEQAALLREIGARHVLDSTSATFAHDLTEALHETKATIAFDAIGGGDMAGTILACMEAAASRGAATYSRYGSTTPKQVYIYGMLDIRPTVLNRSFGMTWGVGGWLVTDVLGKIGAQASQALRARVVSDLKTIFASRYEAEISLAEALRPDIVAAYAKRTTGRKYLIAPHKRAD